MIDNNKIYICSGKQYYFQARINNIQTKITIPTETICKAINVSAIKNGTTFMQYIENHNFVLKPSLHKPSSPKLGSKRAKNLVLGLFECTIRGDLLQNLMVAHEDEIKDNFDLSDRCFTSMIKSLDNVVHVNNKTLKHI